MAARASRIASVLAWVADRVNCHCGTGYRRASSSATSTEASVGSRNCVDRAACAATAATIAGCACPQNMAMSEALKSM